MEVMEVLEISINSEEVDDMEKNTVEEANDGLDASLSKEVVNVEETEAGVVELDSMNDSEDIVFDEVSRDMVVSLIRGVEASEASVAPKKADDAVGDSVGEVENEEMLEVDVTKV